MPRLYRVDISAHAEDDLKRIYDFVSADSPRGAGDLARRLRREILSLNRFPARHPLAPESPMEGVELRVTLVHPYAWCSRSMHAGSS